MTEFPLFTHADADKDFLAHGRWSSSHHPFTAPMREDIEKMYAGKIDEVRLECPWTARTQFDLSAFQQVRGQHYDLVLNGQEIGGGSVRVHDAAMQDYIFSQILQVSFCPSGVMGLTVTIIDHNTSSTRKRRLPSTTSSRHCASAQHHMGASRSVRLSRTSPPGV